MIGKWFASVIFMAILEGCATVYHVGVGEKGKGKFLIPAMVTRAVGERIAEQHGKENIAFEASKIAYSLFETAAIQENSMNFEISDELFLREGSSLVDVAGVLENPERVEESSSGIVSHFYYKGHVEVIFKNGRLIDVTNHDAVNEDFLPVDISIEKRPLWVRNKLISGQSQVSSKPEHD